jgi:mono/diheme cytochrome c family protein
MFVLLSRQLALGALLLALVGCKAERRKSDAELGLNPQQASGRAIYDQYCDRCHEPYSSSKRKGPSLQGVFHREYFSVSGMPANDQRARDLILYGRDKMPAYSQELNQQQIDDLMAYLHTL